jgi:anti-sigma B factor antagonist
LAQLQIEHKELEPGTILIALAGRLMLGEEGAQVEALAAALIGQGYRRFILDLSGLTHIDSTGIGRCIASLNKISQAGGHLRVTGAAGQVREAFRVTRLDRVFQFAGDADEARRSF